MTMWAKYLWELGSLILAFMTSGHLYAAFLKDSFSTLDPTLMEDMKRAHPKLSKDLNMWDSWISFNATHSSGGMFIGLLNFYLALNYFEIFGKDHIYLLFNLITISFYFRKSMKYWFKPIRIGITMVFAYYFIAYPIILLN